MKPLNKKAKRIIENIFDSMLQTDFSEKAQQQLNRDLSGHNVSLDAGKGEIVIEDWDGIKPMYKITIEKL